MKDFAKVETRTFATNNVKYGICQSPAVRGKLVRLAAGLAKEEGLDLSIEAIDQIVVAGLNCQSLGYKELPELKKTEIVTPATNNRIERPGMKGRKVRPATGEPTQVISVVCPTATAYESVGGQFQEVKLSQNTRLDHDTPFIQQSDQSRWFRGQLGGRELNIRETDVLGRDCEGVISQETPATTSVSARDPDYCPPGHRGITGTCYTNIPSPYIPNRTLLCIGLSC